MKRRVILDTGPLVAYLNGRDFHHQWAAREWNQIEAPFLCCEAVLAEACFLISKNGNQPQVILDLIDFGVIKVSFRIQEHCTQIAKLIRKYHSVPMSLADASLVKMSELISGSRVFTTDGDFSIYRRNGRQTIPLITP